MKMRDVLFYFSMKYQGNWKKIYYALETFEIVDNKMIKIFNDTNKTKFITILDKNYPNELKKHSRPPFVLFYKGNFDLLSSTKYKKIFPYTWFKDEYFSSNLNHYCDLVKNEKLISIMHTESLSWDHFLINKLFNKMILVVTSGIDSNLEITLEIEKKIVKSNSLIISTYPNTSDISIQINDSFDMALLLIDKFLLLNSRKEFLLFDLLMNIIEKNKKIYCYNNDKQNHNSKLIQNGAYEFLSAKDLLE